MAFELVHDRLVLQLIQTHFSDVRSDTHNDDLVPSDNHVLGAHAENHVYDVADSLYKVIHFMQV